jgi:ribosomal protein S18 acetylase RimI-like enzyme
MDKRDATNEAFSAANHAGRWLALEQRLAEVEVELGVPLITRRIGRFDVHFWTASAGVYMNVSASHEGQLVGYLSIVCKDGELYASDVAVRPECRRQGLATAMYDLAEEFMGAKFVPCVPHSPYAAVFWAQRITTLQQASN